MDGSIVLCSLQCYYQTPLGLAGILAWMMFDYVVFNWYRILFYSLHLRDRISVGSVKYREEHKFIYRVESGRESFVT